MSKILGTYKNGNYSVIIKENGTKIRETEFDEFIPAFSESCDVKITDRCNGGCQFCYENCTENGKHANLDWKFLDTLHPYTEMALNGNDLTHPDLIPFLEKLKEKKVIANMTVNQIHFEKEIEFIDELISKELIYGLGVSLRNPTPEFIEKIKRYPNAVIHVINGIFSYEDMIALKENDLKLLILGYKNLRRGESFYDKHSEDIVKKQRFLKGWLPLIIHMFKVVSFDNLAIEQLDVKRLMSQEEWSEFFMGEDGTATFYIDLVEGVFAKNSLSLERYPIMDNIDDMFQKIRKG